MALTSMKRKKKSKAQMLRSLPEEPMQETYPYGLKVTLEKEDLEKLDISLKDYAIGDSVSAKVKMEVVSMRSHEDAYGSDSECLELQITGIDLG